MKFAAITSLIIASASQVFASDATSIVVLQYALVLENLENAFYSAGLPTFNNASFSGFPLSSASVYNNFVIIQQHEAQHVKDITNILTSYGATPAPACNYVLPKFTAASFAATARALERVGSSAYAGGIKFIVEKNITTIAATIAEIEARHASYLNTINQLTPFPSPYETPMSPKAVFSLAQGFFSLPCPAVDASLTNLGITALFPAVVGLPASTTPGAAITFTTVANATNCAFYNGLAPIFVPITGTGASASCVVPTGTQGDQFFFLTKDNTTAVTDDTSVVAIGSLLVIAGPTASLVGNVNGTVGTSSGLVLVGSALAGVAALVAAML